MMWFLAILSHAFDARSQNMPVAKGWEWELARTANTAWCRGSSMILPSIHLLCLVCEL